MKIGIITYWQSNDNYGQQLQCWALQKYLREQGHDAYLIRYNFYYRGLTHNKLKKLVKNSFGYQSFRKLYKRLKGDDTMKLVADLEKKNECRGFVQFRQENLWVSDVLYESLDELQRNPPEADVYITGSDQVWSQLLSVKENEVFFLNFGDTHIRRVSYAASFGMKQYPSELNGSLKENLSRFDSVSVREKEGVDICKNVRMEAKMVLDPTLLLDSDKYCSIESSGRAEDYIYIYSLNVKSSDEMYFDEVSKYASRNGYKIIVTPATGCTYGVELFDGVEYDYATIPSWLSNIDNAKLVVTTSFHGIVFCMLMHTPFVYVPLKGVLSKMNNRITNFLSSVGLDNHIADSGKEFYIIAESTINWADVDNRIQRLRQDSYEFLKEAIGCKNNQKLG